MSEDISKIISKHKMYMSFDEKEHEMIQKVELNKIFEEIERLTNNLKEVREYLTDEGVCILNKGMKENERLVWDWANYYELLEILDKVEENK